MNFHKISLKSPANTVLTASNAIVELDDKALTGVQSIKIELDVHNQKIGRVTLELAAIIETDTIISTPETWIKQFERGELLDQMDDLIAANLEFALTSKSALIRERATELYNKGIVK